MSIQAAKLMVVVGGDVNQAQGALGMLQRALGGIGGVAQTAFGFFTGQLMYNGIRAIQTLGREALDSYTNFERLGMALETLTAREMMNSGAAGTMAEALAIAGPKAQELQGWIQKLAIQSPFTQAGVADALKTAMAYGFTTESAQRMTQAMIDFASGSGATEGAMGQIALALGQIQAKGKLGGQEVLQLVNAGLAVDQILAKAFGKSTAEIVEMREKGLIPADKAIEAIVTSLETDFGGAAARQAGTFSGLISSLTDIKQVGLREFFTGTFEAIQPYVQNFVDLMSSPETMERIKGLGMQLGKFVSGTITALQQLPGKVTAFFDAFMANPIVQRVVESLQTAFTNMGTFWLQNGPGLTAMAQGFFEKIAFFGGLLAGQVLPWLAEKFNLVSEWFVANGPLIGAFAQTMLTAFANIAASAVALWPVVKPILGGIIDLVLGLGKIIMQVATGDWAGAWETVKSVANGAWEALKTAFGAFANWVTTVFLGTTWSSVVETWKGNWEMFKQIVSLAWEGIKTAFSTSALAIGKFLGTLGKTIGTFIREKIEPFQTAFLNVIGSVQGLVSWIGTLITTFKNVIIPPWAERHSPSQIEQTFGNWLDYTRDLVKELPKISGAGMRPAAAMSPAMAGGGYGGTSYQIGNITLQSSATNAEQLYREFVRRLEQEKRGRGNAGSVYAGR